MNNETVYGRARKRLEDGVSLNELPELVQELIDAGEAAERERDEARNDRQREHDLRVTVAGSLENAMARIRELEAALVEAMQTIQIFHGPGWDLFRDHSPEMARWRSLLHEGGVDLPVELRASVPLDPPKEG
jgi:hypothetical protein